MRVQGRRTPHRMPSGCVPCAFLRPPRPLPSSRPPRTRWRKGQRGGVQDATDPAPGPGGGPGIEAAGRAVHQLRTGHCRTGKRRGPRRSAGGADTRPNHESRIRRSCGWKRERRRRGGKSRFTIRDLLADGRCTQSILGFLSWSRCKLSSSPFHPSFPSFSATL